MSYPQLKYERVNYASDYSNEIENVPRVFEEILLNNITHTGENFD